MLGVTGGALQGGCVRTETTSPTSAWFDFFGVTGQVEAGPELSPLLDECRRFWKSYRRDAAASAPADLRIELHHPGDWTPYEERRREPGSIFIGPLQWYYRDDYFVLHEPDRVVVGRPRLIEAYLRAPAPRDPRLFVHFTLNLAFIEALRHHGLFYVHGACLVSPEGKRYLIAGDGCQGKSTLTLSLLLHGYRYLSDDAVFLDTRGETVRLLGYHKAFHVGNDLISRFSGRAGAEAFLPYGKTDKSEIDPELLFPEQRLDGIDQADVILMPSIHDAPETRIDRQPQAEVLSNFFVASTQVLFDRKLAAAHLDALRSVTDRARGYRFVAGRDVYTDPSLYHPLIRDL